MFLLLGAGFLGGLITGVSPCVVPVLPIIVAGGSTGTSSRRPISIIAGLVVSFSFFTLVGGEILSLLHLPQDLLRDIGLGALFLVAAGLLIPKLGELLEKPFARLGAKHQSESRSGFLLGISLGLVFVPCAGPVLAAISAVAATHRVGFTAVLVTLSYALGAAIPLLAFALLAQRTTSGFKSWRAHAPLIRKIAGGVLALTALAIALNLTRGLTNVPGYTTAIQDRIEGSASVTNGLRSLTGQTGKGFTNAAASGSLPNLGAAPNFTGITQWLNTPGDKPLTLAQLRGKVVLIDFWTYSCINCERSLPHVEAWASAYKKDGLVVVGVHTPEFPFEHVISNVKAAAAQLGVTYPIAIDNKYATWNAYDNNSWPSEYLIDQQGDVRATNPYEGNYAQTESDIRELLSTNPKVHLPPPTEVANKTPTQDQTPETYIGYERLNPAYYVGSAISANISDLYLPAAKVPENDLTWGGYWTEHQWSALAGKNALMELTYQANDVYLVLGGKGTVDVSINGVHQKTLDVSGIPNLYTLVSGTKFQTGTLDLDFSPGVAAYDFTFG
jgi:cytochrome c biogenesis protein CcdA/thiol-disulfide isomerase/thioredoxin